MQFTDAVAVSGTRRTADGYLVAEARSVRTGIQLYAGSEVGKPELSVVRVYRPADQVFADASLQSFTHAPVTMDHPAEAVTADNWKQLAVGEVSTAAKKDGEWVHLPLILKDAAAIQAVETGKRELSAGYTCELVFGDGVTPEGEAFNATQTNIKINHLAIVDRARAGSKARIGDGAISWGAAPVTNDQQPEKEKIMTLKTVTVDGIPVEVTDQGATVIATLQQRLADMAKSKDKQIDDACKQVEAKDAELAKKDAEIDALKAKVLDEKALDAKVQARADLITVAKSIAKDVKTEGLTDAAIRKAVVSAKLGDAAIAGKPDAYIDARFDILAEEASKNPDPFANAVRDGVTTPATITDASKAYEAMLQRDRNAWQGNQKESA
ncbi:DUF2213 domain-containing protein [Shinella curvata]|uniref:DUF2213 domain-containing protein n=1 Tax=Shinella curvata TaxID=1817964 RepID=A0ABT8XIV5_9HYPH|nr:DUF2213 domain-containing protein [Shinella curvata]MCJ8053854.1 DUF2213 domain-containing protein [Shinella curvata]MDO6123186.1 DUF2213 domain-containing protein [Shinella curvata]